ncbi:MAG: asparagine synthetase B family protein [Sulfurovaceae bacterium]
MSAFFFLMQRDGTNPSTNIVDKLYRKTISWPHDNEEFLIHENIALGQATQWISELDKKTKLPISIEINNNSYLFAGDVRLDNRNELIKQLNIIDKEPSNAELIIHAYLKWGEEKFADRLLGDFSFALYDTSIQKLLCVRDHIGVKPLYYHESDAFFLVSDSIEVILAHPKVSQELNDKVVTEFALHGYAPNQKETFFSSIQKCPRATCLGVTDNTLTTEEYWNIHAIEPLRYETENEYAEHLRNLLETVISDRINSDYPISAHMSGGLDSSVIATIAGRMWKKRSNEAFHTYNWCRPKPNDDPMWHEWADARNIARIEGFEHEEIDCNAKEIKKMLIIHNVRVDGTIMYEYEHILLPQAQAKEIRLILSGFGGDEFLTARFKESHIDKIQKGKFVSAWKSLKVELSQKRRWNFLRLPYQYLRLLLDSILPRTFRYRKILKIFEQRISISSSMLKNEFADYALSNHYNPLLHQEESIQKRQHAYLDSGYHQERMESWAALGRKAGIRYVYPYLDKRIVEFALSIPPALYFKCGQSRYLYRLAVREYLPPFMLDKLKPSEIHRGKNVLHEIYKALSDDEIIMMIKKFNSPYIDNEKYLNQYHKTTSRFDSINDIEELMIIDRLKSILLIKKML